MRFSGKQNSGAESNGEVARLALLPGTHKTDLVKVTVRALLGASEVDRAGVWIDDGDIDTRSPRGLGIFRGMVSERGGGDTPSEWARLSLEALPSLEPLAGGRTVQQDLGGTSDQLMLGALLELRRAVWAPVGTRGRLRGVVLAGTCRKHGALPLATIESISAELALALELEEERRRARQRQADLNVASRLLAELTAGGPIDSIFTRLVDSCTEAAPGGDGLDAVFATLQTRSECAAHSSRPYQQVLSSTAPRHRAQGSLTLCWRSGDAAWLHALDNTALSSIWQRAAEARDPIVIGSGSGLTWPRTDVARIVAIPLFASREAVGTLIAGLRPGPVAQGCVERLELRGELAATALALRQCTAALSLERKRQQAILQSDSAAKIIIGPSGKIGALSRGAQERSAKPDQTQALPRSSVSRRVGYFPNCFKFPTSRRSKRGFNACKPRHTMITAWTTSHIRCAFAPAHRSAFIPFCWATHPAVFSPPSRLSHWQPSSRRRNHTAAKQNCTTLSNGSKRVSCSSTRTTKFKR